jgi:hypothetical protein
MIIDLRNEKDEEHARIRQDLRVLLPTTQNQLVIYCQKKQIKNHTVDEIHIGDGGLGVKETVGFISNISNLFKAIVHFECKGSPGTCFPSIKDAARDNYAKRRDAGERVQRVEDEEEGDD